MAMQPERQKSLAEAVLAPHETITALVHLGHRAHVGKLTLRGDAGDGAFLDAVRQCLDLALPTAPNTTAERDGLTALWLRPDEWLLTLPPDAAAARLRDALAGIDAAVIDTTDAATVFRLGGRRARAVIAKGCPLDLHPRVFGPGLVAQTLVGGVDVILHQVAGDEVETGPAFDLYIRRSLAAYLWAWLSDAGLEYGIAVDAAVPEVPARTVAPP